MQRSSFIVPGACLIACLLFSLSCAKKTEKIAITECRMVSSTAGLNLRETPSRTGSLVATIPYRNVVVVAGMGMKTEIIDGKRGTWIPVTWFDKKGWVFDALLDKEIKSQCSPFYLYPLACTGVKYPDSYPMEVYEAHRMGREVSPAVFVTPPSMLPGQPVLEITGRGIRENRVTSLHPGGLLENVVVYFRLELPMPESKERHSGEAVYIRKQDLTSLTTRPPRHVRLAPALDEAAKKRYTGLVADETVSSLLPGGKSELKNKGWNLPMLSLDVLGTEKAVRDLLAKRFKAQVYPLTEGTDADKPVIVEFAGGDIYDFYAIVVRGKIEMLTNGVATSVFFLDDDLYIATSEWGPHSGRTGRMLYRIRKGITEKIGEDYSFGG